MNLTARITPYLVGAALLAIGLIAIRGRGAGAGSVAALFGDAPPPDSQTTQSEVAWECWYKANSTGMQGFKPFRYTINSALPDIFHRSDMLGDLTYTGPHFPTSGHDCGKFGTWYAPEGFKFTGGVRAIIGDPRALWTLAALLRETNISSLQAGNMYQPGYVSPDTTHDFGNGLDLFGAYVGGKEISKDEAMQRLIEAAISLHCPLAWISPYQTETAAGRTVWPLFQLRDGEKIRVSHSSQNHCSHYHIMFPRPNAALESIKKKGNI